MQRDRLSTCWQLNPGRACATQCAWPITHARPGRVSLRSTQAGGPVGLPLSIKPFNAAGGQASRGTCRTRAPGASECQRTRAGGTGDACADHRDSLELGATHVQDRTHILIIFEVVHCSTTNCSGSVQACTARRRRPANPVRRRMPDQAAGRSLKPMPHPATAFSCPDQNPCTHRPEGSESRSLW